MSQPKTRMSIGFVGWNPFQLLTVKKLIKAIDGAVFVLEDRGANLGEFLPSDLEDSSVPILVSKRNQIERFDGVFDVLVFQVPFEKIHKVVKSKIAMLQYGYAKEAHNYGAWRSFGDLNLTYGPYAQQKIETFSPAVSVGNPRYDDWYDQQWVDTAKAKYSRALNPSKPTVLYAPTWGDLSSLDEYLAAVAALSDNYNVMVKMHHNTDLLEQIRRHGVVETAAVLSFGANDDLLALLACADVFISDYSGAIFDAILCLKPVVLLDGLVEQNMGQKIDLHSLEYVRRADIGYQVAAPSQLLDVVEAALHNGVRQETRLLRGELFNADAGATSRAVEALSGLAVSGTRLNQVQEYVRKEMRSQYDVKLRLKAANKKLADYSVS